MSVDLWIFFYAIFLSLLLGGLFGNWREYRRLHRLIHEALVPVVQEAMAVRHMHDGLNEAVLMLEAHPSWNLTTKEEE